MSADRIPTLVELLAADPTDWLGHLMLGNEYLAADRPADAVRHLAVYCERFEGDKGAACLSLARALEAVGDLGAAKAALARGVVSASAFRHRALLETLELEIARLAEVTSA